MTANDCDFCQDPDITWAYLSSTNMKGICLCHVAATACESCDKLRVLHVLLLLRRPYKDLIGPRLGFTNSFSDRDGFLLVCLSETINTLLGQDWFSSLVPIWDEDSPFTASRKAYKICIPKKPMCQQNPTNLNEWEIQDPKMEVLYRIRPYFVGIFPYIGLT